MYEKVASGLFRVGGASVDGKSPACSDGNDCNIYLITHEQTNILVDCGQGTGMSIVERNLREAGVDPAAIAHLLLTHSHFDHAGAAASWRTRRGLSVHQSRVAAEYFARNDHRLVGYQTNDPPASFEPYGIDHRIEDGEVFTIGRIRITATATPGHTPDSMVYRCSFADTEVWFSGDVTFSAGPSGNTGSVGWLNRLWKSDIAVYEQSLKRLLELPEPEILLCGHGVPVLGTSGVRAAISASIRIIETIRDSPITQHFGL